MDVFIIIDEWNSWLSKKVGKGYIFNIYNIPSCSLHEWMKCYSKIKGLCSLLAIIQLDQMMSVKYTSTCNCRTSFLTS